MSDRHKLDKVRPAPRRITLFGLSLPVWVVRGIGIIVLVAFVAASYVLYTEVQRAQAETAYRACQVDALQRATTVDQLLDLLTRVNIELQDANSAQSRDVRRTAVAELARIQRDRDQARADQAAACRPPA